MTDKQKIKLIDRIVTNAYEFEPKREEHKGAYFEGVISAICAVIIVDEME